MGSHQKIKQFEVIRTATKNMNLHITLNKVIYLTIMLYSLQQYKETDNMYSNLSQLNDE